MESELDTDSSWMRSKNPKLRTREKSTEKTICKWAKGRGAQVWKVNPVANSGWPDRLFLLPNGVYVWLEVKAKGEKPTELQLLRLSELTRRGALAFWSDNLQDMKRWLLAAEMLPQYGSPMCISKPV